MDIYEIGRELWKYIIYRNETVLAKKLKKTLQLKLDNDAETVDALKELSTFFLVIRLISIDFLILHCSKGDDRALHLGKAEK